LPLKYGNELNNIVNVEILNIKSDIFENWQPIDLTAFRNLQFLKFEKFSSLLDTTTNNGLELRKIPNYF